MIPAATEKHIKLEEEILAEGYFPMLVKQENSEELMPVEIEETQPMPRVMIFFAPADFQKFDMPNMGT